MRAAVAAYSGPASARRRERKITTTIGALLGSALEPSRSGADLRRPPWGEATSGCEIRCRITAFALPPNPVPCLK